MSIDNDIYYSNIIDDLSFLNGILFSPTISDIMINADGNIYIKENGIRKFYKTLENTHVVKRAILSLANYYNNILDKTFPVLECIVPYSKIRVEGILPPLSDGPVLVLRKPTTFLQTLENYVEQHRLTETHYDMIVSSLVKKFNILIVGGTGSGKTTFVNTLLYKISIFDENCRLFIIEDTAELNVKNKDYVSFVIHPNQAIDIIRVALRCNPDRIIFGEIRHGNVCLELLKAFNSGHPGGISTIHANTSSLDETLLRVHSLIKEVQPNADKNIINTLLDIVVTIEYRPNFGPIITNVYSLKEYL